MDKWRGWAGLWEENIAGPQVLRHLPWPLLQWAVAWPGHLPSASQMSIALLLLPCKECPRITSPSPGALGNLIVPSQAQPSPKRKVGMGVPLPGSQDWAPRGSTRSNEGVGSPTTKSEASRTHLPWASTEAVLCNSSGTGGMAGRREGLKPPLPGQASPPPLSSHVFQVLWKPPRGTSCPGRKEGRDNTSPQNGTVQGKGKEQAERPGPPLGAKLAQQL